MKATTIQLPEANKATGSILSGPVVATEKVLATVGEQELRRALRRHAEIDRSKKGPAPLPRNKRHEARTGWLSRFKTSNGTMFWIITEADVPGTLLLLASEY